MFFEKTVYRCCIPFLWQYHTTTIEFVQSLLLSKDCSGRTSSMVQVTLVAGKRKHAWSMSESIWKNMKKHCQHKTKRHLPHQNVQRHCCCNTTSINNMTAAANNTHMILHLYTEQAAPTFLLVTDQSWIHTISSNLFPGSTWEAMPGPGIVGISSAAVGSSMGSSRSSCRDSSQTTVSDIACLPLRWYLILSISAGVGPGGRGDERERPRSPSVSCARGQGWPAPACHQCDGGVEDCDGCSLRCHIYPGTLATALACKVSLSTFCKGLAMSLRGESHARGWEVKHAQLVPRFCNFAVLRSAGFINFCPALIAATSHMKSHLHRLI